MSKLPYLALLAATDQGLHEPDVCDGARATAGQHERVSQPVRRSGRAVAGKACLKKKAVLRVTGERRVDILALVDTTPRSISNPVTLFPVTTTTTTTTHQGVLTLLAVPLVLAPDEGDLCVGTADVRATLHGGVLLGLLFNLWVG